MAGTLTFLGAAGTVTGSKFLVEAADRRVLVDAGLFQGSRELRRRNWHELSVAPARIDAVVVTHAHLDHCGYLPILARDGFSGPVLCSRWTAELLPIVLRDAAHLQEQEAQWARETALSRHREPRPLFDSRDAERALQLLTPIGSGQPEPLGESLSVELHRAGHILGSSFVRLGTPDGSVLFSGDLGRTDHPLLLPPELPDPVDTVVVESTYGARRHESGAREELARALRRTLARGGTVLLPAFAVDRTPMLLRELGQLVREGEVPDVPVFVDSPMALAALEVYRRALRDPEGRAELRPGLLEDPDPFDPGRLHLARSRAESEALNDPNAPCVILSASGMASGGRVLHHLEQQLRHARNNIVLTGYQVPGTRGRALADGAPHVKIHGQYVPVRAEVTNIRGFSAHADADMLVSWLAHLPAPQAAYVVHGEESSSETLAATLRRRMEWNAVVPRMEERVRLGRAGTEGTP